MDYDQLIYGAAINLNEIILDIQEDMNYDNYEISFGDKIVVNNNNDQIVTSKKLKNTNVYLNIVVDRNEALSNISFQVRILIIFAILFLLIIPILLFLMHKLLIKPLKNIGYAHNQLEDGNQEYRISKEANSREISEAYNSFNTMADNIVNLKIENMEKEMSRQKMEIRNLQLQIRPHFLLNTFNLINVLVKKNKTDAILDLVIYLSEYFRYIFRSEKELELFHKELGLIRKYLKIAEIRYPGRIDVKYDIEPETEHVRIPPLLIHNFIENTIRHGLKEDEITHISIVSEYENKKVTFRIIDDGKGMDTKEIEKIFGNDIENVDEKILHSHIGLYNSYMRIKYFYSEEAEIKVNSEIGQGTSITIEIPYDLEEIDEIIDN